MTPTSRARNTSHPRHASRPILLFLVYGALLAIVGATATGQAAIVSADSQASLLQATVNADAALVRAYVSLTGLAPDDLTGSPAADRSGVLSEGLRAIREQGQVLSIALLTPDGRVVAASDPAAVGRTIPATSALAAATEHKTVEAAVTAGSDAGGLAPFPVESVLVEYLPILLDGEVRGVVAAWRDATPILATLGTTRLNVALVTLTAAAVCAALLYLIFRAAQQRLTRQTIQLLESTRRDPLTGMLNHGAVVEVLAQEIAAARGSGGVAVALLDIDNFGLLNTTYGHPAGDLALVEVSRLAPNVLPAGVTLGRYGPDEFLVIASGRDLEALEPAITRLRAALNDLTLRFDASERLPLTFSAGIATYPVNGESLTTLLSVLAMTLDEAKASGGDAIRVADAKPRASSYARSFDVLQGLVIAVDTKDRYTRRHSEDVARYADFMAQLLDLDRETRHALHTAGLLHDIGKIGIPDVILRKPGSLTDAEYDIVKQHVALGDMIVRDLPNIELVRAGIRHHHERWDGKGYLTGLSGDEIPVVARILAVADAFSAMTTTRPYRKALTVDEALVRLEDAMGTQLDEQITLRFVSGIRTDADPPLPGATMGAKIWTPDTRVA